MECVILEFNNPKKECIEENEEPNVCKCGSTTCIIIDIEVYCEMCNEFKGVV